MIGTDMLRAHLRRSIFDLTDALRIGLGSLISGLAVLLHTYEGLDPLLADIRLPLLLTAVGAILVWPVFFRTILRHPTRSETTISLDDSER